MAAGRDPLPRLDRIMTRPRLIDPLVALVGQLQLLDGDLVVARVGRRPGELARPGGLELPLRHRIALLVEHGDEAVLAGYSHVALLDELAPFPQIHRVGDAALEGDVVPL